MSGRHVGVMCDGCSASAFSGKRYKCVMCHDYDLCEMCHSSGVTTKGHSRDHVMSEMNPPAGSGYGDFASISCPYCGVGGFNEPGLAEHCLNDHAGDNRPVVCPICAVRPGGDPSLISADFMGHLNMRHQNRAFNPGQDNDNSDDEGPFGSGGRGGRGGGRGGRGGRGRGGRRALTESDQEHAAARIFRPVAAVTEMEAKPARNKLATFSIAGPPPPADQNTQQINARLQQARFAQDLLFASLLKAEQPLAATPPSKSI